MEVVTAAGETDPLVLVASSRLYKQEDLVKVKIDAYYVNDPRLYSLESSVGFSKILLNARKGCGRGFRGDADGKVAAPDGRTGKKTLPTDVRLSISCDSIADYCRAICIVTSIHTRN